MITIALALAIRISRVEAMYVEVYILTIVFDFVLLLFLISVLMKIL